MSQSNSGNSPQPSGRDPRKKSHRIRQGYDEPELQYYHTEKGQKIAYRKVEGNTVNGPQILYMNGFFASMELSKTVVIEQYARLNGFTNVRYDPIGIGKSTINDLTVQVEDWLNSALAMVDHICDKDTPIIIVSSSVGSWMSTHVAMQRPSRIAGLIMCGPAFNCLIPGYWLHYNMLEADQKKRIDEGKEHMMLNIKYGGMKPFRRDFVDNSAKFELDLNEPLDLPCPVRIIHSIQDMDIPYENSMQIQQSITSDDVDIILRKSGNHRLMTKSDCMLTANVLDLMIKEIFPDVQMKSDVRSQNSMSAEETRAIQHMMLTPRL